MNNGSNNWDVSFSHISWFQRLLENHSNIINVNRHDDIVFEVDRREQSDHLKILCCNEYVLGITTVHRGLAEFGTINLFYIGGGWCGYTKEAKQFCLAERIGVFVTDEMSGALWKSDYWNYNREDKAGNPVYFYPRK